MMPEDMRVSAAIPVGRPRAREPIFLEHGVNESFQEQLVHPYELLCSSITRPVAHHPLDRPFSISLMHSLNIVSYI